MSGLAITDTTTSSNKPNKSLIFYVGGSWWGIFRYSGNGDWYIFKYNPSISNWVRQTSLLISTNSAHSFDTVVDGSDVHVAYGSVNSIKYRKYTYSGGNLSESVTERSVSLTCRNDLQNIVVASNGDVLIFGWSSGLHVNWSTNGGSTWQGSDTTLLSGKTLDGCCSAVEFSGNVGVFWAENGPGDYGFFRISAGGSYGSAGNWTSETLPVISGGRGSDDHTSGRSYSGKLYFAMKTEGGDGTTHVLFERSTGGSWSTEDVDINKSRPTLVIRTDTSELYWFNSDTSVTADESAFMTKRSLSGGSWSTPVAVMKDPSAGMQNCNTSKNTVDSTSDIMIAASNPIGGNTWFETVLNPVTNVSPPIDTSAIDTAAINEGNTLSVDLNPDVYC